MSRNRLSGWVIVAVALMLTPSLMCAWGNEGHRAVTGVAAMKMPGIMPDFLRSARVRLEYLGPEPDRWRGAGEYALKNSQEPDHFIEFERLRALGELPRGRYEFYRLLYETRARTGADLLPEHVGLQPYITMEIYDRLKVAFREYRRLQRAHQPTEAVEQNVVFYAGWLSHYVADGSNPLHTSVQYNGWVGPNPKRYSTSHDIHWEMEGPFVERNLAKMEFSELVNKPKLLADPWHDYLNYLHDSNALVERVYELEKAGGFKGAGTRDSREFIRERLAAGAQMLLNMWYTAWVESEKAVSSF
ncbi:MAG: nuclease [Terriglobales bacterium]